MAPGASTRHTFTFHHAELGPMVGLISPDNIVQFRAIPYATIPARFKQSILLDILQSGEDFTQHGHACPQAFTGDGSTSGGHIPGEIYPPPSDEFKCLILQLNIPLAHLQAAATSTKLPVLVYIHGGGFVLGHIDEQHNTSLMVQQSLADATPIISASLQYRLGALGYLHTPGNANLALNDQRNALRWIQKFIGGFGGDKEKVTVFGESAGAMSICAHMLCAPTVEGPLFRRAVLMSGCLGPMTCPAGWGEAEEMVEVFLEKCGVAERGEEGLSRLREVSVDRIVEVSEELNNTGRMWLTVQDEGWFGRDAGQVTWDRVPELIGKCEWVEEIVLGTTGFEGTMFMPRLASISPASFCSSLTTQLGPSNANTILHAYAITPSMDHNLFTTRAMQWMGDVVFEAPTHALALHLSTHTRIKVYRYIFTPRNPFPSSLFYQQSHHWVDIYFVFLTFVFRFPTPRLRSIARRHAQLWIGFANGKAPWTEYTYSGKGDEVVMVADEREGWVERSVEVHEELVEWGWGRCEALWAGWEGMRGGVFRAGDLECLRGVGMT